MIKQAPTPGRLIAMAAFTLSCVGLLLFLWLSFGGTIPLKPEGYRVHVLIPEAANLAQEADVRISGVPVGKVRQKSVDVGHAATDVVLEIDHRYAPIPRDTKAILRQKTLLGETYIELAPGDKSSGSIADGGTIPRAQVAPTVELDEIFRAFDAKTRTAFQRWMMDQGRAFKNRGQDLNDALGNLAPFAEDTTTVLQILDENKTDVRRLIRNTGDVFGALTERRGQLRNLITSSNRVFTTLARRDKELQDAFRVFPTFLQESRRTLTRVTRFANNANPLVSQLRPAARELSPTLVQLESLAPDLRGLFRDIDPLVNVSRAGLPATSQFLDELRPLLDSTDPFLRNLNPMLSWIGLYKHELTAFFANDVASTQASSLGADQKTQLHYLRTTNPLNPENLAIYPKRIASNRSNPYVAPLGYKTLPIKVFGKYLCTTNPVPTILPSAVGDLLPQSLKDLLDRFAYAGVGANIPAPPCDEQAPLGSLIGQSGKYPHIEQEAP
ncbi:MAG TPA: MlaD family protein [Thermoleophilaceae bacterium]|nr:MlaD family protein [Thermoleophilaceae bacterium]